MLFIDICVNSEPEISFVHLQMSFIFVDIKDIHYSSM